MKTSQFFTKERHLPLKNLIWFTRWRAKKKKNSAKKIKAPSSQCEANKTLKAIDYYSNLKFIL